MTLRPPARSIRGMRSTALLLLTLAGCDDHPDAADARPPIEAGAADATADAAADMAVDAIDMVSLDMADAIDMASLDMASLDMASPDMAEAIDMASLDRASPDAAPRDAAPRDLYLPDFGVFELCANGEDDDDDGLIDCGDPDCRDSGACFHAREDCANGIDDDGERRIDCADAYCLDDPRCVPPDVEPYTAEEIQRRFDADCVGCHSPIALASGLSLAAPFEATTVDIPSGQVRGMPLIKPGARNQSFIWYKLTFRHLDVGGDGEGMPQGAERWSGADVERFGRWIDALGTR